MAVPVVDFLKKFDPRKNPKQMEALNASERYVLYGGAVGGAKSAWLAAEAILMSVKVPGNVGYLCRYELSSLKKTTLVEVDKFLDPNLLEIHHKTEHYYKFKNGSYLYYGGLGDDKHGITRITSLNLGWFAIDQAEETSETHFNWLKTRLRLQIPGYKFPLRGLLTANPAPGWVRDIFIEQTLEDHRFIPARISDNPYLPDDYEDQLRKTLPDEMVKMLVEGNWDVDAGSNYLFQYKTIREATFDPSNPFLPDSKAEKVAGVDISRYGEDETVYILRQGDVVIKIDSWSHQDTVYSAGRIARNIREDNPSIVNIDSIGIGAGVYDILKTADDGFPVKAIDVGGKAIDDEVYINKRAEYFNLLAKKFQKGTIKIPDHPKLSSQLAGIRYTYAKTRLQIESKEIARKRGGKSPDYADALMLCFCNSGRSSLPYIRVQHFG